MAQTAFQSSAVIFSMTMAVTAGALMGRLYRRVASRLGGADASQMVVLNSSGGFWWRGADVGTERRTQRKEHGYNGTVMFLRLAAANFDATMVFFYDGGS